MRVRGLKPVNLISRARKFKSHPVRVRGLKQLGKALNDPINGSHPVRVRGLKRLSPFGPTSGYVVAPRAGAWIETIVPAVSINFRSVAPRAGAWIETNV